MNPEVLPSEGMRELQEWVGQALRAGEDFQRKGKVTGVHGVKPLYTNLRAFEANRRELMVLGINPAGDSEGEAKERKLGYLDRILDPAGGPFCSITTGRNGEEAARKRYAERVRDYASSLLGWTNTHAEDRRFCLLPLGNLVPFRAANPADLEEHAWARGVELGMALLGMTRPRRLLLIGSGEGRSCWGCLRDALASSRTAFNVTGLDTVPYAKAMVIRWGGGGVTEVVAVTHPNFQITNREYALQLRSLRDGLPGWKGIVLADPYQATQPRPKLTKATPAKG